MKKNKIYVLIILFVFLIAGCSHKKAAVNKNQQVTEASTSNIEEQKSATPTLFIHGYAGGNASFGNMIQRLETQNLTKKDLVLTVNEQGDIQAAGSLSNTKNNPSVQILFEDNKSHEWNQAEWIKKCLQFIHDTYAVTEVNLVGHSMGGASSLRFLTTFGNEPNLPKVNKFVAIAAPFNNFIELPPEETLDTVIANGPTIQSERYADYVAGMEQVANEMKVLLIAGDVGDGSLSDGTVPVTDALSVMSLFKSHGNQVKEKVFYGTSAQHSQLHENAEVDQLVGDFLWNK